VVPHKVTLALLSIGLAAGALAQTPAPATFEVASIKPSPPDASGMFIRPTGGGVHITGATLRNMISLAYNVRPFQIVEGPGWIDTERFDIEAKSPISDAPPRIPERLKSLLADRFQLELHPETKEQPVYALVLTKGGPKFQESTEPNSLIRMIGRGTLRGRAVGISMLALNLSNELGRRVIDQTGLTNKYDFELKWTPTQATSFDTDGPPSIFTALQEQLGLRLQSERGPVEMFQIIRVEKPSSN